MPGGLGGRYRHGRGVGEMPEQYRPVDARGAAHHELVHPGRVRRPLRVHALRAQPRILEERPLGMEQVEPARQSCPAEVRVHRLRIEPARLQHTLPQIEPVVDVLRNVRIVEPVTTIGSDPRRDRRQNPHQARRCRRHRHLQVLDLVRPLEQLAQAHARRPPGQQTHRNPRLDPQVESPTHGHPLQQPWSMTHRHGKAPSSPAPASYRHSSSHHRQRSRFPSNAAPVQHSRTVHAAFLRRSKTREGAGGTEGEGGEDRLARVALSRLQPSSTRRLGKGISRPNHEENYAAGSSRPADCRSALGACGRRHRDRDRHASGPGDGRIVQRLTAGGH
ncbi:hypothetical protein SHIRM173S_00281 [Streptomyces hirsutus]